MDPLIPAMEVSDDAGVHDENSSIVGAAGCASLLKKNACGCTGRWATWTRQER